MCQHWKAKVEIVKDGLPLLPRCDQYEMHMPADMLFNHRQTVKCNKATRRQPDREMWR